MSKRKKRSEALRSTPKSVRPEELAQVLLDAGFEMRPGKGDHRFYFRGVERFSLDFGQNPVKPIYVRQVLELLEGGS